MVGGRRSCQDAAGDLPSAPERAVVKYPRSTPGRGKGEEELRCLAHPLPPVQSGQSHSDGGRGTWKQGGFEMPALVLGAGSTRPRRHRGQVRTGPVGVESDLLAESPVFMARGGPDPGLLPLSWHWVPCPGRGCRNPAWCHLVLRLKTAPPFNRPAPAPSRPRHRSRAPQTPRHPGSAPTGPEHPLPASRKYPWQTPRWGLRLLVNDCLPI